MQTQSDFTSRQKLNLLIVWAALTSSCFIYPIFLDGGLPIKFNDQGIQLHFALIMSIGSWVVATAIRWVIIPKLSNYAVLLGFTIAGLAFTEATIFYSIFLLSDEMLNEKALIFWVALLSMAQFFPLLLNRTKAPPAIKKFD